MFSKLLQSGIALVLLIITTIAVNSPINVNEIENQIAILTEDVRTLGVQDGYYPVTKVVDGDTIEVEIDGTKEKVRLLGINTPESVDPRRPVECFGKEASQKTKELLEGKHVRLENDSSQSDKDRYGRLLRYVFLEDGTHINLKLLQDGYAQEYTYDGSYKYQNEFKQAAKKAQSENNGLWNSENCRL